MEALEFKITESSGIIYLFAFKYDKVLLNLNLTGVTEKLQTEIKIFAHPGLV